MDGRCAGQCTEGRVRIRTLTTHASRHRHASPHIVAILLLTVLALAPSARAQSATPEPQEQTLLEASGELALDAAAEASLAPGDRFRVTPVRVERGPDIDGQLGEEV